MENIIPIPPQKTFRRYFKSSRYGTAHEPFTIRELENKFQFKVEQCGIFIDEKDIILRASPDGLVGENAIVEVKCPKTTAKKHPKEAIQKKIINFCTLDENYITEA